MESGDMEYSLEKSGEHTFKKVCVNRMGTNPRSSGSHNGILFARFEMAEAVFKTSFHDKVPALCCVWSRVGVHATAKPAWRQPPQKTPSRMKYAFTTACSMHKWLDVRKLCVPLRQEPSMVMCPFPKGFINRDVLPFELVVVVGAVIGGDMVPPSTKAEGYSRDGLQMGEGGIVLGKRCVHATCY